MCSWPEKAITYLFECYYESLLIISQRYTNDLNASEDVVQEILTHLWRNHDEFGKHDGESIESYLVKRTKAKSKSVCHKLTRSNDQQHLDPKKSEPGVLTCSGNRSDQEDIRFLLDNIAARGGKFDLDDDSYDGMRQIEHNIEWIRHRQSRMVHILKRLLIVAVVLVTSMSAIWWFTTPVMSGANDSRENGFSLQQERLPDNSIITMRENSNYLFFHHPFYRSLTVCGEARIQISKDLLRPLFIDMGKWQIKTFGACVLVSKKNGLHSAVQVISGTISVVSESGIDNISSGQCIMALPNGVLQRADGSIYFHEWYSRLLKFSAVPLNDVVRKLEEEYHVIIEVTDLINQQQKFTGTFYRVTSVDDVLGAVCKTFRLRWTKSAHDSYVLTKDEP